MEIAVSKLIKVKAYVYSPDIPEGLYINHPQVSEHSFTVPGEDAAHFLQLKPFKQYQYFVPPGTYY